VVTAWPVRRPDEEPTSWGVLYLASVLDLHSRLWGSPSTSITTARMALAGMFASIAVHGGPVTGGLLPPVESDEYTGEVFKRACKRRRGDAVDRPDRVWALDNAIVESFNSTLEFELLSRQHFSTRGLGRRAVARRLDEYNRVRRHSTDGMLIPVEFEYRQAAAAAEVAA